MHPAALFRGQLMPGSRYWCEARDADPVAFDLFRRHYSYRRSSKRRQAGGRFIGPGEYMLLIAPDESALFAWRKFIPMDDQQGVNCAIFRNEGPHLSSDMIRDAEALAWARWPGERFYTYVNPRKVRSANPGYCFIRAGWQRCGYTSRGLCILEKLPEGES